MSINVKIQAQYEEFMSATAELKNFFGGVMDGMKAQLKDMSDQAKADMKGHESATEQFANVLKGSMSGVTGAVEGVKIAWAQLAVVFAAGAFLKKAVDETVAMTVEAQKLGRELGISATQASYVKAALGDVNGTTAEYTALNKGLVSQLSKHELALRQMGLATRDQNGDLKDNATLMLEALEVVRGYKEGTDRNIAIQRLFGQSAKASAEMLDLTAESFEKSKEKADAFNLAVGKESVEEATKYRAAMNDMNDIMDAVMRTIGEALLPVLNDLAEWFSDYGPTALLAIKIAIDIVISLFKGLAFAAKALWEIVVLSFNNMITVGQGFAQVFTALFRGDFAEAKAAAEAMMGGMATNVGAAFDKIMSHATETRDSLADMWGKTINGSPVTDSGKEGVGGGDRTIGEPAPKKGSDAEARRAAAEAKRLLKEKYDAQMEIWKGEEEAAKGHWDQLLDIQRKELAAAIEMYGEKSKQAQAVANKIADTERAMAAESVRLSQMRAESNRNLALGQIDIEERAAQAREQMGLITYQQLLQQQRTFEEERYQIMRQGLVEEAVANADKVEAHQATLNQLAELDQVHQARVAEIGNQAAIEAQGPMLQVFDTIQQGFATVITGLINRTMTWGQAVRSVCSTILGAVVNMLAQWAAKQLAHYLLDGVMHKTNAASKAAIDKAATLSQVTRAAAQAGALGTASFAGAPWPINMGAPAFGLAMFAASMSYAAGAAAEQGYDVPAGVNPVTQLHQKEMVLPAKHADVIRNLADEGTGGTGAGDQYHFSVQAMDARGVKQFFQEHAGELIAAMRRQTANA